MKKLLLAALFSLAAASSVVAAEGVRFGAGIDTGRGGFLAAQGSMFDARLGFSTQTQTQTGSADSTMTTFGLQGGLRKALGNDVTLAGGLELGFASITGFDSYSRFALYVELQKSLTKDLQLHVQYQPLSLATLKKGSLEQKTTGIGNTASVGATYFF